MTGSKMEKLYELCSITVNKNAVLGDTSALVPGGVRLGTPALTTRGLKDTDFRKVAEFLHRGLQIGLSVQSTVGGEKAKLVDFLEALKTNTELPKLKAEVELFAKQFPLPG
jgi:glycine hydroxymethyltransferase